MAIDLEATRWRSGRAAEIAGLDVDALPTLRKRSGLAVGTWRQSEFRFSAIDIAELSTFVALRALAFTVADAIETAHGQRRNLKDLMVNRVVHGFWSHGGLTFPVADFATQTLYLDAIGERVISKLALPLPVRPIPRTVDVALRMVDAIFDYFESPPGVMRWRKWHAGVVARGGRTSFDEAAAELGAPVWFLVALQNAITGNAEPPADPVIVEAMRPRAPKASENMSGVVMR